MCERSSLTESLRNSSSPRKSFSGLAVLLNISIENLEMYKKKKKKELWVPRIELGFVRPQRTVLTTIKLYLCNYGMGYIL